MVRGAIILGIQQTAYGPAPLWPHCNPQYPLHFSLALDDVYDMPLQAACKTITVASDAVTIDVPSLRPRWIPAGLVSTRRL
jgi:hypothetical protein